MFGQGGITRERVAKMDVDKLITPKEWGWRFLAFDFIMPNHQIVECYIVFAEMEEAKKAAHPAAAVCPRLSNHEIFEKWRGLDTGTLAPEQWEERERDIAESRRRYDLAFYQSLSHSTSAELESFWKPLGYEAPGAAVAVAGCGADASNTPAEETQARAGTMDMDPDPDLTNAKPTRPPNDVVILENPNAATAPAP